MKPISPDDVVASEIPDFVIDIVNRLIRQNYQSRRKCSVIEQREIVKEIKALINIYGLEFDIKWLDFEEMYRNAGWNVEYDKPGYNESYEATFKFTKKEK